MINLEKFIADRSAETKVKDDEIVVNNYDAKDMLNGIKNHLIKFGEDIGKAKVGKTYNVILNCGKPAGFKVKIISAKIMNINDFLNENIDDIKDMFYDLDKNTTCLRGMLELLEIKVIK